jgi:hypothetical protein
MRRATRPTMRFLSVKSVEQQDLRSVHRARERITNTRTALINHIRGLLGEYGIVLPQGPWRLVAQEPVVIADAELSDLARTQDRMYGAACPYGKFDPYVLVMQSTQDGAAEYGANGLVGARDRRILVQRKVRTRLIVVIQIRSQ